MGVFKLERQQYINASIQEVWAFFSDPGNLSKITPDDMSFKVTSQPFEDSIYPGQIITYKVAPILNIHLFWMTEITHVTENKFFVDEQRVGPYKIWHHEHHFKEHKNGVLMTDIVHYQPPLGILGNIANNLFINKQLEKIFNYRHKVVEEIFNS